MTFETSMEADESRCLDCHDLAADPDNPCERCGRPWFCPKSGARIKPGCWCPSCCPWPEAELTDVLTGSAA
jgi:hypothetical protein